MRHETSSVRRGAEHGTRGRVRSPRKKELEGFNRATSEAALRGWLGRSLAAPCNWLRGRLHVAGIVWAVVCLAGCAVGPNYKRPAVRRRPETFRGEAQAGTNSFADLPWWEVFHDPALRGLIRVALTNNYDLRIAYTRVEQAREVAAEARAGLFPQVNYSGLAGGGRNVVPLAGGAALSPTHTNATLFSGNINASWEIDLWGRVRRLSESARAQYFAGEEARRDVTVSLIAQVAQDYFQLLELDRQLAIQREATNSFGQSLNIFDDRLRHGVASKLETSSAEALLDSAAANIPDLESQIAQQENLLSFLIGTNPGPVMRAGSALENQSPPEVPAGLPSDLLERRPDILRGQRATAALGQRAGSGRGQSQFLSPN